ncbi:MAG: hypothetical protein SNJ61_04220 [Fimbriimonadaceae bacterium]
MFGWVVCIGLAASVIGSRGEPESATMAARAEPPAAIAPARIPKPAPPLVPIAFPSEPIEAERARGRDAYRKSRNLIRTFDGYRQSVGRWAAGPLQQTVEDVLWLSPEWAARWLGYHEAKEKWPPGELERRWSEIAFQSEGRLLFVVRLSAFPRHNWFGEVQGPADPTDLEPLRFLVTLDGDRLPERVGPFGRLDDLSPGPDDPPAVWLQPSAERVGTLFSNDPASFANVAWWRWLPFASAVRPEFEPLGAPTGFLGEYRQDVYVVSAALPPEICRDPNAVQTFQLRIFSPRRERVASFDRRREPARR